MKNTLEIAIDNLIVNNTLLTLQVNTLQNYLLSVFTQIDKSGKLLNAYINKFEDSLNSLDIADSILLSEAGHSLMDEKKQVLKEYLLLMRKTYVDSPEE